MGAAWPVLLVPALCESAAEGAAGGGEGCSAARHVGRDGAKIAELRQQGFTLTEISEASQLSIGVVHKASREGAWLRPETADRILELEVVR